MSKQAIDIITAAGTLQVLAPVNITGALTSGAHTVTGNLTVSGNISATSGVANLTTTGSTVLGDAITDTLNVSAGGLIKDSSGNLITKLTITPPTLTVNNQLVLNLTSDTTLRISVRGSDGVTRVVDLTLV